MTKETKIGLFVGLLFIIAFAVILSHKGAQPEEVMIGGSRYLPAAGPEGNAPQGLPPGSAALVDQPGGEQQVEDTLPYLHRLGPSGPVDTGSSLLDNRPDAIDRTMREVLEDLDRPGPAAPLTGGGNPPRDVHSVGSQPERPDRASPQQPLQEYKARPNDSLWKIAKRFYGPVVTRKVVDALFEANRNSGRLTHPNKVQEGATLVVPDIAALIRQGVVEPVDGFVPTGPPGRLPERRVDAPGNTGREDSGRSSGASERRTDTTRTAGTREYTVQNGDSLARIAREKLGSEALADEILKLNRDRVSNPNLIIPGDKLRIPIQGTSDLEAGRSQL